MIHILNNFPKDYDVILDGLKNCLTVTFDNVLTFDMIHEKKRKKSKKKKLWVHTINNISNDAENVVSMTTNMGIKMS